MRYHFKDPAHGVTGTQRLVHLGLHALLGFRASTVQQDFRARVQIFELLPCDLSVPQRGLAYGDHVAKHLDLQFAQKKLGEGAQRHPRRRFAC